VPRSTWGTSRVLSDFGYRTFTFCGVLSQALLLSVHNPTSRPLAPAAVLRQQNAGAQPPCCCLATARRRGLDSSLFARHYWGNPFRFLLLELLRCFNSLRIASGTYEFSARFCAMTHSGLPHSEISGSKPVCDSPEHIAAYHVLHRLSLPSHSS